MKWCTFPPPPPAGTPYNLAGSKRTARTDSRSTNECAHGEFPGPEQGLLDKPRYDRFSQVNCRQCSFPEGGWKGVTGLGGYQRGARTAACTY